MLPAETVSGRTWAVQELAVENNLNGHALALDCCCCQLMQCCVSQHTCVVVRGELRMRSRELRFSRTSSQEDPSSGCSLWATLKSVRSACTFFAVSTLPAPSPASSLANPDPPLGIGTDPALAKSLGSVQHKENSLGRVRLRRLCNSRLRNTGGWHRQWSWLGIAGQQIRPAQVQDNSTCLL